MVSRAASSLSWKWDTRRVAQGAHSITVTAADAADNTVSDSITVYK
jgi:hypothetical protein